MVVNKEWIGQDGQRIQPLLANTAKDGSGTWYIAIVDSSGRLVLGTSTVEIGKLAAGSNVIGKVGHDITGIGHGIKTVASAGADEVLASSTPAKVVIIQAQTDNIGVIAVGASGVDATVATGTGILLNAGDGVTLEIDDLADVYIDATASGEGVRYTYLT